MSGVLYLEPVGGIAGDMFLAACLDIGVAQADLVQLLGSLRLPGWHLEVSRAVRHAIEGTHVEVVLDPPDAAHERPWREIRVLIDSSSLPAGIKQNALATFGALAAAEARVHGTSVEEVHFHEVGAIDSIVDLVGAACCLELLGNPEVFSAPPPLGSGTTRSRHGVVPIPGPATLNLLVGRPVRFEGVGELTTPTGAAILRALTSSEAPPPLVPRKVGFGVGTRDFPDRPNLLRATLGERVEASAALMVMEANLDDMSPQLFGQLFERLLAAGALDVWAAAAVMKKGRPGQVLGVLCEGARAEALRLIIFEESTTLGIRSYPVDRVALSRSFQQVDTRYGPVRMKIGRMGDRILNAAPEYEDCAARAREKGIPVKEVIAAAIAELDRLGHRGAGA